MRYLFGCWIFWYTLFFGKNKTLSTYRMSRFKAEHLIFSNAIWSSALLFVFKADNYNPVVLMTFGMVIIQFIVMTPSIKKVNVFIKSKFSDNYIRAQFKSWLENQKDREQFLEELYLFERAAFDKWVAEGGPERDRIEKEQRREKRKAEFEEFKEEIKNDFKSAWHETWGYMKSEQAPPNKETNEDLNNNRFRENEKTQYSSSFNERMEEPIKWALKIMELPGNTNDYSVIRSRYRTLMKIHHPDTGGNELLCKQLIDAYGILAEAYKPKAG